VPEIPTDQYVDPRQRCDSNVLGIDVLGATEDSLLNVPVGQFAGFLGEFHVLPVCFCHLTQDLADGNWSGFKLQTSEVR